MSTHTSPAPLSSGPNPGGRIPVAVLGATGTVGIRLVQRLARHPWFQLAAVAASTRSEGRRLGDAVPSDVELASGAADLVLQASSGPFDTHLVLSALPADVAREVEPALAAQGHLVVSNASAFRADPEVPLVVPEVNPDHLSLLDGGQAGIVTNPNCAVAGLMPVFAPLHDAFGLRTALVTTFQAISGAGRPGPPASSLVDNVVPWIGGEEDKIAREPGKILGSVVDGRIHPADLVVSATATRVPVLHGHLESVSVELERPASVDEVKAALETFRAPDETAGLPSSPARPVVVVEGPDRPQPRLDRDRDEGMTVVVGRVRECAVLSCKFVVLSHNLERGAAGAAMLNAELATAQGRVRAQL